MLRKIKLFQLIAGVLFLNIAGFFLRYFGSDTYFILLGFRFHFSLLLSFLLVLYYVDFHSVKELLKHPVKQKPVKLLVLIFFPLLIIPADIFILKELDLVKQDYFFELGLSSIVDFPLYLVWNSPQFILLYIFLNTAINSREHRLIKASLVTFSLFLYEIIPVENILDLKTFNYIPAAFCLIGALLSGLFFALRNIYLFTLFLFSILWINVLMFGSNSKAVVNIFLASQYYHWDGIINLTKGFIIYIQPVHLLIVLLISFFILRKNGHNSSV